MMNIILFGPPGAGKGTQSDKLIHKYNLIHLSTGDLFRIHLSNKTELGIEAKKYMDDGNLVPDSVVIGMVEKKIQENLNSNGFIFDGFPRTVNQAVALDEVLNRKNLKINFMICLDVDDTELKARIQKRALVSGRIDDQSEKKINNRIEVYKKETLPVVDHYKKLNKYNTISGFGSINDIFINICSKIDD
jgi:adenylate kinase